MSKLANLCGVPHSEGITRRSCRACRNVYARAWRQTRAGRASSRAQHDILQYTQQETAKKEVYKAVRAGRLPRAATQRCVDCGACAAVYDHRDYLKPLAVDPVCRRCDKARGPGKNKD